ncbi:MAG: hypothetical protein M0021_11890 [Clostridia bacterium]|nr:hypothetical protein [Clostridia bacterium]
MEACLEIWKKTSDQHISLENELKRLGQETIPQYEQELAGHQRKIIETYNDEWCEQVGEPRFQAELTRLGHPEKIHLNFSAGMARTESQRELKQKELLELRSNFNRDFRGALDITAPTNVNWTGEWQRLTESCLTEYEEKIKGAKEKAQREFQEDFISKLRQSGKSWRRIWRNILIFELTWILTFWTLTRRVGNPDFLRPSAKSPG